MVPKTTHKKIILDDMEQPVPCRPRLAASKLKLPHGCGGLGLAGLAVQLGWQPGWAGPRPLLSQGSGWLRKAQIEE